MRELIVDYIPFDIPKHQIAESMKENDGKLVVKGVLQRADAKNQNGRVYPREILTREAKNYNSNFIQQKRAMGELDHPDSSVVNLQNVSHNVTEMHFEGLNLLGTVEILTTPAGKILRELFKNGIKLGISSRGMGSVETVDEGDGKQPSMKVGDDFELIAFDFVSNPSTHGAFMHPLTEGINRTQTQGRTCGTYCKAEDLINKIIRGE
jgi:hypothetical protein